MSNKRCGKEEVWRQRDVGQTDAEIARIAVSRKQNK